MKPKYKEGQEVRKKFEAAMTAIFQVKKEEVPRPQPKKRTAKRRVAQPTITRVPRPSWFCLVGIFVSHHKLRCSQRYMLRNVTDDG